MNAPQSLQFPLSLISDGMI